MKINRVPAAARPKMAPPRKLAIGPVPQSCFFSHRLSVIDISPKMIGVISRLIPVIEPKLKMRSGNINETKLPARMPDRISKKIIPT